MKKLLKIFIGISFLVLIAPLLLFGQNNLSYQSIRLFESGLKTTPQDERDYSMHFSKADTRYIYYEIDFKNNLYNIRDNPATLIAKFYKPDGSLMGEPTLNHNIPSDWDEVYLWHGWGWPEGGNWDIGTYRLVIYMDNKKITETLFSIYDEYWTSPRANK